MKIPEYELEYDVLKCVCVIDGELEVTSPSFVQELSEKTGFILNHVYLVPDGDLAPPCILATYAGDCPERDLVLLPVEFTEQELDALSDLY